VQIIRHLSSQERGTEKFRQLLTEQEASHLRDAAAIEANLRLQVQALADRGWALHLLGEMAAAVRLMACRFT
jgi:hypothetical protein